MLLQLNELPADVATIAGKVAKFIGVDLVDLTIRNSDHEQLTAGAYSIAYEDLDDWAHDFSDALSDRSVTVPADWFIGCGASWKLHLYPEPRRQRVGKRARRDREEAAMVADLGREMRGEGRRTW